MLPKLETLLAGVAAAHRSGEVSSLARYTAAWVDADSFASGFADHSSEVLYSDGLEAAVDLWVAAVNAGDELRVGYHELGEGD